MAWNDHVLPHGDLVELSEGLWEVTGSLQRQPLPRNMVVWRMPDGGLLLHSVVALDDAGMAALEALGTPTVMVVPSGMHRLDAAVYKERYPDLEVLCPAAARQAVHKVVAVDGAAEERATDLGFSTIHGTGMKPDELCFELPLAAGGVAHVYCDALFNLDHLPGFGGFLTRLLGSTGFFGTTWIGRRLSGDLRGWKAWLEAQSRRDDVAVICVAHGKPITQDCNQRYAQAAARL